MLVINISDYKVSCYIRKLKNVSDYQGFVTIRLKIRQKGRFKVLGGVKLMLKVVWFEIKTKGSLRHDHREKLTKKEAMLKAAMNPKLLIIGDDTHWERSPEI